MLPYHTTAGSPWLEDNLSACLFAVCPSFLLVFLFVRLPVVHLSVRLAVYLSQKQAVQWRRYTRIARSYCTDSQHDHLVCLRQLQL